MRKGNALLTYGNALFRRFDSGPLLPASLVSRAAQPAFLHLGQADQTTILYETVERRATGSRLRWSDVRAALSQAVL
jgi:hypothetical protein